MTGRSPAFASLARVHVMSTAADACFTVSLAGSLFVNVSVDAARPRILLYLLFTMAPFAVVAPLVGPLVDRFRSGHRLMLVAASAGRATMCLLLVRDLRTLLLYPEAFVVLVLGKSYSVTKSALVPRLVPDAEDLVVSNSRLSRMGTLAGIAGGVTGAAVLALAGGSGVVLVAAALHTLGAVFVARVPRTLPAGVPRSAAAVQELHAPPLVLAASSMGMLRAAVGFLAFAVAFSFKRGGEAAWLYGLVLAAGAVGGLGGTFVAPVARRSAREEPLLLAALGTVAVAGLAGAVWFGTPAVVLASAVVGLGATGGRQAFDSFVQHAAPDADRGRAFARFETRFQLAWVLGALLAVVWQPTGRGGLAALGGAMAGTGAWYVVGLRSAGRLGGLWTAVAGAGRPPPDVVDVLLQDARDALATGAASRAVAGSLAAAEVLLVRIARMGRDVGGDSPVEAARGDVRRLWGVLASGDPVTAEHAGRAVEVAGRLEQLLGPTGDR